MQNDFSRHSCQIALPGFGEAGQLALQQARVLIAGAGGLGCPAAQYLAASGVGVIGIADYDVISTSNLHRQVLYTPAETGLKKAATLCRKLQEQNPGISLIAHDLEITAGNIMELIACYDLVVDCTDNFDTKYLLNDACVLAGKPLVYGAIYQYEGQVAVWNILNKEGLRSPNYRDLFPEVNAAMIPNCADGGVIPTLAGIIGCMQANEVIKYFTHSDDVLAGKVLIFDAQSMQSRIFRLGQTTQTHIAGLPAAGAASVITLAELRDNYSEGEYRLVDVRTAAERAVFHIGGEHIPLNEVDADTTLLNSDKAIIFYCASGKRSAEAVKMLKKKNPGISAFSLKGGVNGLQAYS